MPLVVVKDKAVPLIAALPFKTIEPAPKPPPKLMPPDEVTVKALRPWRFVRQCR